MRTLIAPATALLLLTACGGNDNQPNPADTAHATAKVQGIDSPKDLAQALGCDDTYNDGDTDESFVLAVGTCDYDGEEIRLLTFTPGPNASQFANIAVLAGGGTSGGLYVYDESGWAVELSNPDSLTRILDKIGGHSI